MAKMTDAEFEVACKVAVALAKAEKYWTATEAQVALRDRLVAEMGVDLTKVASKTYPVNLDVDRLYLEAAGPSNLDPQVRELALRLTEGGCKAHATAFLLGIPPRFVGGMISAAKSARTEAAKAPAEAVAS